MSAFVKCRHWQDRGEDASGGCTIGLFDGRPTVAQCVECPSRRKPQPRPAAPSRVVTAPAPQIPWGERGPRLWAKFHARPRLWTGAAAERLWLAAFHMELALLPGVCGCVSHWGEMLIAHPPDLSSPAAYARWQHARHNEVRARLKQPQMPYDVAEQLWGWSRLQQ